MYATELELIQFAAARGHELSSPPSVLLTRAADYIQIKVPEVPDPVPGAIKTAQMVASLLIDSGDDLLAPQGQRVTAERVDVISVEYSDRGRQSTYYPQLIGLLRPFMGNSAGSTFALVRG